MTRQRGAALLTAMVIVALVATLASAMIWQQWRAVQVEAAERGRIQAQWILVGAVDWARLILREDARSNANKKIDHLGEPWATPLAEAKLSSFLAADRNNTDDGIEAFLSGGISDATARYNLRNLIESDPKLAAAQVKILARLLESVGADPSLAPKLSASLLRALPPPPTVPNGAREVDIPTPTVDPRAPLEPVRLEQMRWLGIDAATLAKLEPYVTWLPVKTKVNLNTAPREVLAAVIEGMDLGSADRLVSARQTNPFESFAAVTSLLPGVVPDPERVDVKSDFFEVTGRLRLGERLVEQRAWVQRKGIDVIAFAVERRAAIEKPEQR